MHRYGQDPHYQFGIFERSAIGSDAVAELERVFDNGGERADAQAHLFDARAGIRFERLHYGIDDAGNDGKLVHVDSPEGRFYPAARITRVPDGTPLVK
jgi:hypothetical protein